jgi:predicted Rossmann-fold nucleotide-binding protein
VVVLCVHGWCSVIPRALMGHELCGQTIGDLIPVDDMHQRKAEMARLADAFIAFIQML